MSTRHDNVGRLTPCTIAPLPEPLTLATAPPLMFASDRCLLTSCVVPKEDDAARFSPDMLAVDSAVAVQMEFCCLTFQKLKFELLPNLVILLSFRQDPCLDRNRNHGSLATA